MQNAEVAFKGPKIAEKVVAYVLGNFAEDIRLDDLAREAGMTRFNFCRRFQKECGVSPMRWLWNFRTILAAEFINLDPRWSLTDIAFSCGFTSSAHFSRSFKAMFKQSPSAYKKGALQTATPAPVRSASSTGYDAVFATNTDAVIRAATTALAAV